MEGFAAFYLFPLRLSGKQDIQISRHDLHNLGLAGVKLILAGLHDPNGLFRAVAEDNCAARHLSVKINIGLLYYAIAKSATGIVRFTAKLFLWSLIRSIS